MTPPTNHLDTVRIYATSKRDGVDYNLAYIGADFTTERRESFDQSYMRALFDYGYQQADRGINGTRLRQSSPNRMGASLILAGSPTLP